MTRKILLLIILAMLLFSVGCGRLRTSPGEVEKLELHKGFEGLEINFVENHPPDEIGKDSKFTISLELRNKGPYSITDGTVVLSGFDPNYLIVEENRKGFDLEGKSIDFPEGDYERLDFSAQNIGFPEGSTEYPAALRARAYYDYGTEASAEVCINPDVYGYVKTEEVGCEVKEVKLSGGQGAPVAVTRVEEIISTTDIGTVLDVEFRVYISNKAKGEVLGDVNVDEVLLSNKRIKCEPEQIKLKEKEEKSTVCKTTVEKAAGAYLAPLITHLSYTYTQKTDKKFRIVSLTT